jgi:hypothetical protein
VHARFIVNYEANILKRFNRIRRIYPSFTWFINLDVYEHPEKYLLRLPTRNVVADSKVSREIVNRYVKKIKDGKVLEPIIVFKHSKSDLFAVVDGHHRYQAYIECEKKEINCTLEGVIPDIIFKIIRRGYLQNKSKKGGNPMPAHERVFSVIRLFFKQFFHRDIDQISLRVGKKDAIKYLTSLV